VTEYTVGSYFVPNPNKVKSCVYSLLIFSAYQMNYLDNIPNYAVVDEALRIVRKRGNQTLAKFANGVIRNFTRRYETMADFIQTKEDPREKLTLEASLLPVRVDYFVDRFGLAEAEKLAN